VREWAARLPFVLEFGPHRFVVEWRDAAHMGRPGAESWIDLEHGRIELAQHLEGLALAGAFLDCVLRLSQGSRSLRSAWAAAAPSHRLAAGLVEFAWRNPRAWLWLNLLLEQQVPGRPRFDRALRGRLAPLPWPRRWIVGARSLELRLVAPGMMADTGAQFDASRGEIRLESGLAGSRLAVVLLRELIRAMPEREVPGRTLRPAWRPPSRPWLQLVRDNPRGWCALLQAMRSPEATRQVQA
jgi:hypothetical protein